MRKIVTVWGSIGLATALALTGCARTAKPEAARGSVLEGLPFVYKMTVQQGTLLTEEMIDALELGMTKRQVSFLLGTPPLVDFFHTDRWDYIYSIQRGHRPREQHTLTLYFKDDQLVRIEGDRQPNPARHNTRAPEQILVDVPDQEPRQGILRKALKGIGLEPAE
ncbi:outer membrane protein assembly factor BamE [Caldichromatium japonicum]|uniref:Outer membrane protein assembly factor BamE n=1 Tax=Caldichromatium japonicum TaxID=2699430 RepID=A0A6G7VEH9_9GAMM|nr:outer membrane protein assembly factor BamE [Caldichromatium japonicum]QIK38483.1 outer membrane protein assembly factor BamE [Caldichromatium japonicum]